jgi:hypothetical protein
VGAVLDLAGDQRRPPEQPGQDGQEQQQQAGRAQPEELAAELLAERGAAAVGGHELGMVGARQAAPQAQVVEGGAHLPAGRDQEERHRQQGDDGGQGLLAVLAPDQPGHAWTSCRLGAGAAAGPGRVPAEGSAR